MEDRETTLAAFSTNSFAVNPYAAIYLGIMAGMGMMWMGIMAGFNVFLCMVLLFAGILLVYGFSIGKVRYTLTVEGVQQNIRRFIPYLLFKKEQVRFIRWNQVRSFKNDTDKMRSGQDYEFLKLYLNTSPGEIWITDQHDKHGFRQFRDAFLGFIRDNNNWADKPQNAHLTGTTDKQDTEKRPQTTHIRRRKGFYETTFAKVLTIFFTLLTLLLIWVFSFWGMGFTNSFRLMFVLIPGTVYMLYRVFFSGKKSNGQSET